MFIFGYLFIAFAKLIGFMINSYIILIIVDTILSWVNYSNYNNITRFISSSVEPVLINIKKIIPPFSSIDLSPMIAILILYFIDEFLVNVIYRFGEILI